MPKLKIGIILDEMISPLLGGAYSYYSTLISGISDFNFNENLEIVFLNFSKKRVAFPSKYLDYNPFQKPTAADYFRRGILELLRRIKISGSALRYFEKLHLQIRNERIEKFMLDQGIELLYFLSPGKCSYNIPFVSTHWDIGHISTYAFPEMRMNYAFDSRNNYYQKELKKAFAIFCESQTGKEELVRYTGINPQQVFVIPMFAGRVVNLNVSEDLQLQYLHKFELQKNEFFFYPAQFWAHKNHYNLVKAFEKVLEQHPQYKLVLCGADKGNFKYIKGICSSLRLRTQVIFPGYITDEEVYTFYRNSRALVMPTFLGPTNMPLIEAAILGCPVLTSNLPGHIELLGNYPSYFDPCDASAIADCMLRQISAGRNLKSFESKAHLNDSIKVINDAFTELYPIRKTWGIRSAGESEN